MERRADEVVDLDEMKAENSRANSNIRVLYLALNDVVAFERAVQNGAANGLSLTHVGQILPSSVST